MHIDCNQDSMEINFRRKRSIFMGWLSILAKIDPQSTHNLILFLLVKAQGQFLIINAAPRDRRILANAKRTPGFFGRRLYHDVISTSFWACPGPSFAMQLCAGSRGVNYKFPWSATGYLYILSSSIIVRDHIRTLYRS